MTCSTKTIEDEIQSMRAELRELKQRERVRARTQRWKGWLVAVAVFGLASLPVVGLALPDLPQVAAGDPITAESWNDNFQTLVDAITVLENDRVDDRLLSVQIDGISGSIVDTASGIEGTQATIHSGGAVVVTFPPGMFGGIPICVATHAEPTSNNVAYHIVNANETEILVTCRVTVNGNTSSQGCNEPIFNLLCAGRPPESRGRVAASDRR